MAKKEQPTANRNYKDTVFRMLFSDRKNLLSLYNAVSGSHYDDPEKLEIITLENAIYMGMKNDLLSSSVQTCFCMNISLLIVQICHCEIYSIFPVNIRNWSIINRFTLHAC